MISDDESQRTVHLTADEMDAEVVAVDFEADAVKIEPVREEAIILEHGPDFDIVREIMWPDMDSGSDTEFIAKVADVRWKCTVCGKKCQGLPRRFPLAWERNEGVYPTFCSDGCGQRYLDEKLYM